MAALPSQLRRGTRERNGKKYFTLDEARRALPLVRRIALDLQTAQRERIRLQGLMNASEGEPLLELERQTTEFERLTDRMEVLLEELMDIGVELKDASAALLDFPARYMGREVSLCWKGGEDTIQYWHEVTGGYEGRKPVSLLGNG
jgi:hypothetical protein